ncbi:hypothetical protein BT96DRAFT_80823 [Gymnopus androsaceus JB14]|uniref:Secreted protein n=1 Tax=Gymnopus androsaceus JB14 TaxID=1447944 RepID=A0A6A4GCX9_9AGAR|nr:hypothetical protein BT96DRAFT_80823 [Gymnopus androsaceus JB14]
MMFILLHVIGIISTAITSLHAVHSSPFVHFFPFDYQPLLSNCSASIDNYLYFCLLNLHLVSRVVSMFYNTTPSSMFSKPFASQTVA